jgi:hypothetical protein
MCAQCMAGAATAGAAATGLRTWIFAWAGAWLTPRRRVYLTRALVAAGLVAAALVGPTA